MIYYRKTLFGSGPKLTAVHMVQESVVLELFSIFFTLTINSQLKIYFSGF